MINYISSPEVNFLRSIVPRFRTSKTKLVFRFLGPDQVEPSTNQTYGSLLKNLTLVKTFASAILVPKYYIWRLDSKQQYLLPSTSLVLDAHKEGLEIYASEFANDFELAYNYSYDPLAEYLSFIDNGKFSVDGMLTDFPITPAEAIGEIYTYLAFNLTFLELVMELRNFNLCPYCFECFLMLICQNYVAHFILYFHILLLPLEFWG